MSMLATPGGVPAASASATCSLPGEPKAASSARSTSLASHAVASRGRSPTLLRPLVPTIPGVELRRLRAPLVTYARRRAVAPAPSCRSRDACAPREARRPV
eukprot:3591930-Pleurochrysis_carterae.AAC.1